MKYFYSFIIILFLFPMIVNAQAKDAVIEISKNLDGASIDKYQFTFVLKDLDGNVLQKKKNVGDKVVFDAIKYTDEDIGKIYYYTVTEENDSQAGIGYDDSIIYVGVTVGEDSSKVAFVNPNNYQKKKPNPFHASSEDLVGEAYAVYDVNTQILTFFRGEKDLYTNSQVIDDKVYFAGFENGGSGSWLYHNLSYRKIKKIVFQDAVKPTSIRGWFENMPLLEDVDIKKLDTSLVTSFYDFFYECPSLRHLDISTMDVSQVTDFSRAFKGSGIEELDFTLWDLEHLKGTRPLMEFVNSMPNLKYLDISNFDYIDSSAEFASLPCLEYVHLGNRYKFECAGLDGLYKAPFLKLEDLKLYSTSDLKIPYSVEEGTIGGYYVRPACTSKISFSNTYREPSVKVVEKEVTLKISEKVSIKDLIPDVNENALWGVRDSSILKVDSNIIFPLKVGKTIIETTDNYVHYQLEVNVIFDLDENPKTGNEFVFISSLMVLCFGLIVYFGFKKKFISLYKYIFSI